MEIHHDNAKPHVDKTAISYLKNEGIRIIRHMPYSPDQAPCNFWLFDYIKQLLTDHFEKKISQERNYEVYAKRKVRLGVIKEASSDASVTTSGTTSNI